MSRTALRGAVLRCCWARSSGLPPRTSAQPTAARRPRRSPRRSHTGFPTSATPSCLGPSISVRPGLRVSRRRSTPEGLGQTHSCVLVHMGRMKIRPAWSLRFVLVAWPPAEPPGQDCCPGCRSRRFTEWLRGSACRSAHRDAHRSRPVLRVLSGANGPSRSVPPRRCSGCWILAGSRSRS